MILVHVFFNLTKVVTGSHLSDKFQNRELVVFLDTNAYVSMLTFLYIDDYALGFES